MKKKILHVDMDGVLCDFTGAFNREHSDKVKFPQSRWGFFTNLAPIPSSIYIVKQLMEIYDVYILTRPSYKNALCYTEKRLWIENYFGLEFCKKIIMCDDKSMVKGDFLVDDSITDGQLDFEGELIRFGTPEYDDWFKVYDYLEYQHKISELGNYGIALILKEKGYPQGDSEFYYCRNRNVFGENPYILLSSKDVGKLLDLETTLAAPKLSDARIFLENINKK
jgi:5'-nucleotidase